MLSSVVAPVTAGSASVPLLVKLLLGPVPRSAMATRSVSRTPSPLVSAKCLRLNVPLLRMLLSPPVNCTKPVMVPLLMTCGIAGNSAIGQCADAAVIGQGRGAPGRAQDNAGGR